MEQLVLPGPNVRDPRSVPPGNGSTAAGATSPARARTASTGRYEIERESAINESRQRMFI